MSASGVEQDTAVAQVRPRTSRFVPSFRTAVALAVWAIAVPLCLLAAGAVWELYRLERARAEESLLVNARSLAVLVDAEFERAQQTLRTLAGSAALARGDLASFREEMVAAATRANAAAINLIDPDRRFRVSTIWPLGRQPDVQVTGTAVEALQTGRPTISKLYRSPSLGVLAIGVTEPSSYAGTWVTP